MADSTAISSSSLSKTYSDGLVFRKKFTALRDVSFEVEKGQVFGLLGPNGAGKTTFIKILLGIIRKTSGAASILNYPAGSRAGRMKVGYLPEHLRIPPHMTAYTALECYGNMSNVPNSTIRDKRDELLELVGLKDRAKEPVKKFSKGMLQRLGLATALLHDPPLLILDEPTDGLDPRARAQMRQIIKQLQEKGVTIFLNSHILQEVEMSCQQVAILDKGKLLYSGNVNQIDEFVSSRIGSATTKKQQLNMELSGDLERVDPALTGHSYSILPSHRDNQISIEINVDHQGELDQIVDRLRADGISICTLIRKQLTLEDAFLKIVHDPATNN